MVLARVGTVPIGSGVWAEDEEQVWILAEVMRQESTRLTVRSKETGAELQIDLVRVIHHHHHHHFMTAVMLFVYCQLRVFTGSGMESDERSPISSTRTPQTQQNIKTVF